MSALNRPTGRRLQDILVGALLALGACAGPGLPQHSSVLLTGNAESPPVRTSATGSAYITVLPDRSVRGELITSGLDATAAHIHEGAPGTSGPVVVSFTRVSTGRWVLPARAVLSDSQYASYQEGRLYVNVTSDAHPGGEIRGKIPPPEPRGPPATG